MAVLQVDDMEGRAEVVVFPNVYESSYSMLEVDTPILVRGRPEPEEDSARMIASEIQHLATMERLPAEQETREVEISVRLTNVAPDTPDKLRRMLASHRGHVPVALKLEQPDPPGFLARVVPNRYLYVDPAGGLVEEIEGLLGKGSVRLVP